MKNASKVRRAAIGALVAAAMAVSVQAEARVYRFPAETPSWLPVGRARMVDGGSGGILARARLMLASVRPYRDAGWEGLAIPRLPAKIVRTN